jgi:hypothetical protein
MMNMSKSKLIFVMFLLTSSALFSQSINNPRSPAEWEEVSGFVMEANIIRCHPDVSWEEAVNPFVKAVEICINEGINYYVLDPDTVDGQPDGVNMDTVFSNLGLVSPLIHVIDVPKALAFPWARDHGPYTVYENQIGETKIMGFPGDTTAHFMADYLGKPYTEIPQPFPPYQYFDGGNWLTDGHGTFNICNTSNTDIVPGLTDPAISAFHDYLGIEKTLNVKGVGSHADYWIKMINEKTFVVSHIPQSNYDPVIDDYFDHDLDIQAGVEAIQTELENAFGGGFKFHYITNAPTFDSTAINSTYLTADASYTNSVILNKTVIVPQFVSEPFDSNALKMYREIMPGYNIVGANCRQIAVGGGAMHCISREIFADNPIYITHVWYPDSLNQTTNYRIDATIEANAGIAGAVLYWTADPGVGYQSVGMEISGDDAYSVSIPGQSYGTRVYYYIEALSKDGKTMRKPMVAPDWTYNFLIHEDGVTPVLSEPIAGNRPNQFVLIQNYPNPFNSSTSIRYQITGATKVNIKIYNALGQLVRTLVTDHKPACKHSVVWDGKNDFGQIVVSGIYICRLQVDNETQSKKMIFIK